MNDDFGTFVSTSGPRLLRFAVLITGQRADAEDLLQEVLLQAYPRWRVVRGTAAGSVPASSHDQPADQSLALAVDPSSSRRVAGRATMADGRRYRIAWAPGAVLPD